MCCLGLGITWCSGCHGLGFRAIDPGSEKFKTRVGSIGKFMV